MVGVVSALTSRQLQVVSGLQAELASTPAPRSAATSRQRLEEFLRRVTAAWFDNHAADPTQYAQELAHWNRCAGWGGTDVAQAAHWNGLVLTPKFFGGAVEKLDENYVLSLSLNHKKASP
jgi:hypothetical protein